MNGFGERLQYLINRKNLSQKDLADHFGYHRSLISKWISYREQKPRRETVEKIAGFFGCDFTWLATGEGQAFPKLRTEPALEEKKVEKRFVKRRQADLAKEDAAKDSRNLFKMQCLGLFDELFDFVADRYGEDRDAVEDFMEELSKTNAEFNTWRTEKKERRERDTDRSLGKKNG